MSEEQAQQSPDSGQLMQLLQQQGQQIAALSEQLSQSNERFNSFTNAMEQGAEEEGPHIPDAAEEELESMTNAQLVNHLENRLGGAIQNAIGAAMEPVSNDLAATQQHIQNNNTNSEINEYMRKYPDFQPLANNIADIIQKRAEQGYNIPMEDAYHIARAQNPDTVAKAEQESNPQPRLAGGLLPTSRMIGEQTGSQDMPFEEAMDKAFKEEVPDQGLNGLFDESGISLSEVPETQQS